MKDYLQEKWKMFLWGASFLFFINVYFGILCGSRLYFADLLYLDLITAALAFYLAYRDYRKWKDARERRKVWLQEREQDQAKIRKLRNQLQEMSDYTSKWAHEVKLPLASLGLMNERNQDEELSEGIRDCLERIQQLLNTMMMSSKLKSLENDVRIEKISLEEVVREAIKNQSYFLIRNHFQIKIEVEGLTIYSDRRWLVYVLDQLLGNAVKYHKENPALLFGGEQAGKEEVHFWVKDFGIGIRREELPYIFDKGYIGSNLRREDYRSTGMGLYFAKRTLDRLGIDIEVSSEEGKWTRFFLIFRNTSSFYILD